MLSEQREVLDEIVIKMRSGRISRRTFLERAAVIGLTSGIAASLLDACGATTAQVTGNGAPIVITWESEHDSAGIYNQIADTFNKTNKDGIHVVYIGGPVDTGLLRSAFVNMLQSHNNSIDVMSLDIIWTSEFASNKWTYPIDDQWPPNERAKYLPGLVQSCTFNDHVWAAPYSTGFGLIYYRKDLVPTPPRTWDEMAALATEVLEKIKYGYVWQGAKYEGLVCNFVEVVSGYGGAILDPNDPNNVVVDSPEAQQALNQMIRWVGKVSPTIVTTFKEEDARLVWQNGEAAFMRNWPYAYALGNDPGISKIIDKFDVHQMLYGGGNTIGHSCLGGWHLGINTFSKKHDAAWKFIEYMIGEQTQKKIALTESLSSTLTAVYDDPLVRVKNPFVGDLKTILHNAKPRPVSPYYSKISEAILMHIHQALEMKVNARDALRALRSDLQAIVSR